MKEFRERAGVSLSAIASATKINASFFAAFERNDLSRWPRGIYRRAFFRDYATAIGHPAGPAVHEFVRLFCTEERTAIDSDPPAPLADPAQPLRLTLATPRGWAQARPLQRLSAAAVEALALLAGAGLLTLVGPVHFATAAAAVAFCYYPLTIACLGQSGVFWWLERRSRAQPARPPEADTGTYGEDRRLRTRTGAGIRVRWRRADCAPSGHGPRRTDRPRGSAS